MADYLMAKGWLSEKERRLLFVLAQSANGDGAILNIGVEFGASIVCLCEGNSHAQVIGVDLELPKDDQVRAYPNFRLIVQNSNELVEKWRQPIALLFIDGDHSGVAVLKDLGFTRHITKGGYVALHDCWQYGQGIGPKTATIYNPELPATIDGWLEANKDRWVEMPSVDSIRYFKRQ